MSACACSDLGEALIKAGNYLVLAASKNIARYPPPMSMAERMVEAEKATAYARQLVARSYQAEKSGKDVQL